MTWEDPAILFPDVGLDTVNPAQLAPPPGLITAMNGQSLLVASTTQVFWLQNFITLKRPLAREVTPSGLGNYAIQAIAISPFFTKTAIPAYDLAEDSTNSAVWYTGNVAAIAPSWTKGADISGIYNVLRATSVDGGIFAYAPGGGTALDYDFIVSDQGWTVGDSSLCAYTAGLGWADTYPGTDPNDGIYILSPSFSARDVNAVIVEFSTTWSGPNPRITIQDSTQLTTYGASSASGTTSIAVSLSGATGITDLLVIADPNFGAKSHFAGYITGVTIVSGVATVRYSSDNGATWGSALTLGGSPGAVGGMDCQPAGTVSYAASAGAVYKATTLGGAYSSWYSVPSSANPVCLIVPWFRRNSTTRNTAVSDPDVIIGCDNGKVYWIDGTAATATDITPTGSTAFEKPNALTVSYGHHLAVFTSVSGTRHLFTSKDGGATYTDRGSLTAPTWIRCRRNDDKASASGSDRGQLYLASGSAPATVAYTSKWASSGGSVAGLFPRTMAVSDISMLETIY